MVERIRQAVGGKFCALTACRLPKLTCPLLIIVAGLLVYSNTFHSPFVLDDYHVIVDNPVIKNLDNFVSSAKGHRHNPDRYIAYLSFALNYRLGGLEVFGYHLVNLFIHLTNALLVYLLVILTGEREAASGKRQAASGLESSPLTPHALRPASGIQHPASSIILSPPAQPINHLTDVQPPPRALRPTPYALTASRLPLTASRLEAPALLAALLFAVHPVQTGAVTYIAQRFTSLAAMFYLLTLILFIKGRRSEVPLTALRRHSGFGASETYRLPLAYYAAALLSAVLAMKTKETALTLPLVIVLYELCFFRPFSFKRILATAVVSAIPIFITLFITWLDTPARQIVVDLVSKTRIDTQLPRWDYLLTQARVITTYLRLIFLPFGQNLDYDYPVYHSLMAPPVLFSCLFLVSLLGLGVYLHAGKRQAASGKRVNPKPHSSLLTPHACRFPPAAFRLAGFGIFFFFITMAVESSIFPIKDVIFEHRLYLPAAGLFPALSAALFWGKRQAASGKRVSPTPHSSRLTPSACRFPLSASRLPLPALLALCAVALIVLSGLTYARNSVWRDSVSIWEDTVKKSPGKARPHNNLGLAYEEAGRLDEAAAQFLLAAQLKPGNYRAYNNLGNVYAAGGKTEPAIEQYTLALQIKPDYPEAHNNLALVLRDQGQTAAALEHLQKALRLKPDYPEAHNNLGVIHQAEGQTELAIEHFQTALGLRPDYGEARENLEIVSGRR